MWGQKRLKITELESLLWSKFLIKIPYNTSSFHWLIKYKFAINYGSWFGKFTPLLRKLSRAITSNITHYFQRLLFHREDAWSWADVTGVQTTWRNVFSENVYKILSVWSTRLRKDFIANAAVVSFGCCLHQTTNSSYSRLHTCIAHLRYQFAGSFLGQSAAHSATGLYPPAFPSTVASHAELDWKEACFAVESVKITSNIIRHNQLDLKFIKSNAWKDPVNEGQLLKISKSYTQGQP